MFAKLITTGITTGVIPAGWCISGAWPYTGYCRTDGDLPTGGPCRAGGTSIDV